MRTGQYVDDNVRRVSDDVARIAGFSGLSDELQESLRKKQAHMSRFRQAMVHLAEVSLTASVAVVPVRRQSGDSSAH